MWAHEFSQDTDLCPNDLWYPLTDIANWPSIDRQIEQIEIDGNAEVGKRFRLKPRGGPKLKLQVTRLEPPHTYADVCNLPLASMTTTHELRPTALGTQVHVRIEVAGLMSFFWGPFIGKKHASGLKAQTDRLIEFARDAG